MKRQTMKVSLIVPIYNVETYLPKCLDSIINQKYLNLDIILVDDGSTDESAQIADKYAEKDNRVRVIHKSNEGVSTARNVGIDAAVGDYICFADADDWLADDYVSYLLEMAIDNNVDIAITTRMSSTFKTFSINIGTTNNFVRIVSGENAAAELMYYKIPIGCYCKIFKKDFLDDNKIRFIEDVYVGEGFNFNAMAFQYAKNVAIGNKAVYCYRRDNSASCMTAFRLDKCEMAIKAIGIIRNNLIIKSRKLYKACDFAYWHTNGDMYNWMVLAKVQKKYYTEYSRCLTVVKRGAFSALFAPVRGKEYLRALLQFIHPRILASLLEFRRWKNKK